MPRLRRPGAPEPKRRSRKGCWPCKARKIKCGEEKPSCLNCQRQGDACDYSIRLSWGGRIKRKSSVGSDEATVSGSTVVAAGEDVSAYGSSLPKSRDPVPRASPSDTGESLGSLSGFNITTTVTQPVSFLRRTIDELPLTQSETSPEQDRIQLAALSSPSEVVDWAPSATVRLGDLSAASEQASLPCAAVQLPPLSSLHGYPSTLSTQTSGDVLSPLINPSTNLPGLIPAQAQKHCQATFEPATSSGEVESPPLDDIAAAQSKWRAYLNSVTDNYGFDCGRPDLDLNKNNDHAAIEINSGDLPGLSRMPASTKWSPTHSYRHRLGHTYYTSAVPINLPRYLSPLPRTLLQNPVNLMYFHHYINHTARMLVPHDCGDNPFVSVMPGMAVADPNLLNLMLAYSASHRARYLEHTEPANRIAHWVSDVFPTLRLALEGPHQDITDSQLATAVMLLSLKIISPSTFEVPIPWQSHLKLVRDLFLARGLQRLTDPSNRIGIFLSRWFAYLDILGSLSCRHAGAPLVDLTYPALVNAGRAAGARDEFHIDCFTGFTPRTGLFLLRLGVLTHQCDNERFDENGVFDTDWGPSPHAIADAGTLLSEYENVRGRAYASGSHYQEVESQEMMAMEEAFASAGLLHLYRRVLGYHINSRPVIEAHDRLIVALSKMRKGSSAEVGTLFPLFTAGCESQSSQQRSEIMERIHLLEGTGMKQIQNARNLMQRCWDSNLPWVALAEGEFLG